MHLSCYLQYMSVGRNIVTVVGGFRFSVDISGYTVRLDRLHNIVVLKLLYSLCSSFFFFLFLNTYYSCSDYSPCGESPADLRARIVGGDHSSRGWWPWQIAIFRTSSSCKYLMLLCFIIFSDMPQVSYRLSPNIIKE